MGGTCPGHDLDELQSTQRAGDRPTGPHDENFSAVFQYEGWAKMLAALESAPSRNITLTSADLPEEFRTEHRDLIMAALQKNLTVRSLTLGDISSQWMRAMTECLSATPHITELRFMGSRVDDTLAKILGIQLQPIWVSPPTLQSLVVANPRKNALTDRGAMALVQPLEDNRCLRTLVLFGTFVGDSTARAVVAALATNASLEVLVLYGKALGKRGLQSFTHWVEQGKLTLKELVIGGSDFNDEDAEAFAHALTRRFSVEINPKLQSLGLLNVLLGDTAATALADVVHAGLSEVNILAGQVSSHGAEVLAQAVVQARQMLTSFSLASSKVDNDGLAAFQSVWSEGSSTLSLELAFGGSSEDSCSDFMAKAPATDVKKRRIYATRGVSEYLEEILFPRLMLRTGRGT
mmetsp:Transcript_67234/g.161123  ORF Transcript_67234/g.161123 Transcript_67234/m.161123 type:complete len:406 (+) Transcript_67234:88-1305(+)